MSVQPIIQILEKLEKMHKSLLELAYKKTEIVKNGDMGELDLMLKNEQSHVAAIETLEKQRQQLVKEYLNKKGLLGVEEPTLLQLIEATETAEEKRQIETIREQLMSVIDDLKEQNEMNQKLILQSLQVVNMTLEMFRPQRPEQINYSGKSVRGEKYNGSKKSYFDSQA